MKENPSVKFFSIPAIDAVPVDITQVSEIVIPPVAISVINDLSVFFGSIMRFSNNLMQSHYLPTFPLALIYPRKVPESVPITRVRPGPLPYAFRVNRIDLMPDSF